MLKANIRKCSEKLVMIITLFVFIVSSGVIQISANDSANVETSDLFSFYSESDVEHIYDFFVENGVTEETADELIERIKRGEILDSSKSEYATLEAQSVYIKNNETIYKTTYPDGSIKVATLINIDTSSIELYDVFPGQHASGSGWWSYTGTLVKADTGNVYCSFYVDYSGGQGVNSVIDRVYDHKVIVYGLNSSYKNVKLSITRKSAFSTTPASARLSFEYGTFIGSGVRTLDFNLLGTKATSVVI